jgi:two-component system response regulator HydG
MPHSQLSSSSSSSSATTSAGGVRGAALIVDDDARGRDVLVEALQHRGFRAVAAGSAREAMALLASDHRFEVVLSDLRMPEVGGLDLTQKLAESHPILPVVVITAFGTIRAAVDATRKGAYDFLTKPYDLDVVALTLDRAIAHYRARAELEELRATHAGRDHGILTRSPAMQRVLSTVARIARQDVSVLVTGESGTGKELIARAIHAESVRSRQRFVAINCAAVPETLLESELFGHARGAFTDANTARAGVFAQAHKGTLFLDEIGDMPLSMQAKLLRALADKSVRPVGSDREVEADVRVVAATHKDLEAEVAAGRFREDLFYRIQVVEIVVPPLRARGGDVLLLATEFARRAAQRAGKPVPALAPSFAEKLQAYDWPGNVRELSNCIERAVALSDETELRELDLPTRVRSSDPAMAFPTSADDGDGLVPLDTIERRYILHVLRAVKGNKRAAAQILGLDRSTLYRKLERYGEHEVKRDESPG